MNERQEPSMLLEIIPLICHYFFLELRYLLTSREVHKDESKELHNTEVKSYMTKGHPIFDGPLFD